MVVTTYPSSHRGDRLRQLRVVGPGQLILAEGARALGMPRFALSQLESGEAVLGSEEEWDRAEALLQQAKDEESRAAREAGGR